MPATRFPPIEQMQVMAASRYFMLVNAPSATRACQITPLTSGQLPLPHLPQALDFVTQAHAALGLAPSSLPPDAYEALVKTVETRIPGVEVLGAGSYLVELALASVGREPPGGARVFGGFKLRFLSVKKIAPTLSVDHWQPAYGATKESLREDILHAVALAEGCALDSELPQALSARKPAL